MDGNINEFNYRRLFEISNELAGLQSTIKVSFTNFDKAVTYIESAIDNLSNQYSKVHIETTANKSEIANIKKHVKNLYVMQNKFKKVAATAINKINNNLTKEIKKANEEIEKTKLKQNKYIKKPSLNKWYSKALIISGLLAALVASIKYIKEIKDFVMKIIK